MGATFAGWVSDGPLLLALVAAALAGLVSFLSPCILPLVPGYLSYVTGLAGADLDAALGTRGATGSTSARNGPASTAAGADGGTVLTRTRHRGRVLAGTLLFVAGFAAVYTTMAVFFAGLGRELFKNARTLEVVGGALIILFGLAFAGLVPGIQREFRIHRLPAAGLLGAPVFGGVFALSWVPCVGPTLGAVLLLAAQSGHTGRAAVLALAYCLGLGLPFVLFGLAFRRLLGVTAVIRRHSRWVTRVGGALLILIGLALVTGGWSRFVIWLQTTIGLGEVSI